MVDATTPGVDSKQVKTVGEHWVCAELARRSWAPALTRDGLARTDILAVSTALAHRPRIEVQVKTATKAGARDVNWPLGRAVDQVDHSGFEWFILAVVPAPPEPLYAYVVPRDHVAAATFLEHQNWRTDPTVLPGRRNAPVSQARASEHVFARYRDRWDLLNHPTADIPILLPQKLLDSATDERVGLPPGHPWHTRTPLREAVAD
ncbi:hypothetical protein AB4Z55_27420 [Gordonia sp. ABKF26]|uniref:hypothetical protein n=1 Tax=Gordonia sp. ABKF26 TaxID=3238687 RepID=UPI0034E532F3